MLSYNLELDKLLVEERQCKVVFLNWSDFALKKKNKSVKYNKPQFLPLPHQNAKQNRTTCPRQKSYVDSSHLLSDLHSELYYSPLRFARSISHSLISCLCSFYHLHGEHSWGFQHNEPDHKWGSPQTNLVKSFKWSGCVSVWFSQILDVLCIE